MESLRKVGWPTLRRFTQTLILRKSPFSCCDGWYRFQGNAGTKMPTSCVAPNKCSTHATGWLNGAHPSVEEGKVTKKVCFSWASNCCTWSINIEVINCGDFFLYHFRGTPPEHPCHLRYCGTDWGFDVPIRPKLNCAFLWQALAKASNHLSF